MPLEIQQTREIPNQEIPASADSPLRQELGDIFGPGQSQEQITRSNAQESSMDQAGTQELLPSLEIEGSSENRGASDSGSLDNEANAASSEESRTQSESNQDSSESVTQKLLDKQKESSKGGDGGTESSQEADSGTESQLPGKDGKKDKVDSKEDQILKNDEKKVPGDGRESLPRDLKS